MKDKLTKLDDAENSLITQWKEKERRLKDSLDVQLLNSEAEYIDAATKGHEAFLEFANLGVGFSIFQLIKYFHTPQISFL